MSKPIALAIDFKKFTFSILETGLFLKKNLYPESKVILFHAIETFLTPPHYLIPYLKKEENKLKMELLKLSQKFKNENILVETEVIFGNFWEALKGFIEKLDPYLLVIGYQPYKLKIPTAEKMLERLKCNFLVVKNTPLKEIKKVLCCIDFSDSSLPCLELASFISKKVKADLKVLNVIPEIKVKEKSLKDKLIEEEKSRRKEMWENLIRSLTEDKKIENPDLQIEYGDRVKEIIKLVNHFSPDLLIIGKTGKILKSGLGSVTKELLKVLSIPIFIVESV